MDKIQEIRNGLAKDFGEGGKLSEEGMKLWEKQINWLIDEVEQLRSIEVTTTKTTLQNKCEIEKLQKENLAFRASERMSMNVNPYGY